MQRVEPGVAAVPHDEVGHPVQRLAEYASGLAGGDDVVDRGRVRFAGHLPDEAADVGIDDRGPETVAARSREAVHRRALVWMLELIGIERIDVVDPVLRTKMVPGASERGAVNLD